MTTLGPNITREDLLKLLGGDDGFATKADADQIWILIAGFLVFFMHAGFTMLESGSVRHKNAVNIMFKNIGTLTISGIAYYLFGYAFAYGADNSADPSVSFIGSGDFALSQITNADRHSWFFQWTFAATASTIISGAVAGRVALPGYFFLSFWMTSFVYPVVSHWIWATGGWASAFNRADGFPTLFDGCGMIDYAGSGVVHMTGGFSALYGAKIVGPRLGRFGPEGVPIPPHNLMSVTLGTMILWFGWYGFNVGSTLAFDGQNAAKAAVTTTLSPSMCGVTAILYSRAVMKHFDLPLALNSVLAGLVSITAGCTVVEDWAAIIIGFIGFFVYRGGSNLMVKLEIDDPVDAVAVHGCCGIWGVLAVGIFATPANILNAYGEECAGWTSGLQFGTQLVGVLAILGWVTLTVVPFFFVLRSLGIWRVSAEMEREGLDVSEHGGQKAFIGSESTKKQASEAPGGGTEAKPTDSVQEVSKT